MPRLRSRSTHTPTTQNEDTPRNIRRPKTVSVPEKHRKPIRKNRRGAKMSAEWEEEDIAEQQEENAENFEVMVHEDLAEKPPEKLQKTPDRRSTFELETSINSIDVLKRDSMLEKPKNGLRNCFKKKKRSTEGRNLRKKVNLLLETTTPPSKLAENALEERGRQKIDLLKHTLTKKFNANFSCTRTKMPNFAAIHNKQYARMEDIASMQQRKDERAQLLLSGSKPPPLKTKNNNTETVRAKLFPESEKKRTPSTPKVRFTPETRGSPAAHFTALRKATPVADKSRRKTKEGFTRYGFKKIPPVVEKKQQVAVVATKSNTCAGSSSKEKRKEVLKGVRTNRRFELLMAMRKGHD